MQSFSEAQTSSLSNAPKIAAEAVAAAKDVIADSSDDDYSIFDLLIQQSGSKQPSVPRSVC